MRDRHDYEDVEFEPLRENEFEDDEATMECEDECGWEGPEWECDEKEEMYYGHPVTYLACPRCGERARELDAEEHYTHATDPDTIAERKQMGFTDF